MSFEPYPYVQDARVTNTSPQGESAVQVDPMQLAVIANRLEMIVREMTNTLQRAAYSPIISVARDFSCSLVTGANELLASAEGLPVHIFGSHLQAEAMTRLHADMAEGDAYLHNDVYLGNSHAADHAILVPVYVEGEHLFTCIAKGHLADVGNALPTTYMPTAVDVYAEGALVFPCVRIQRGRQDVEDIIRMCQSRLRVPEQWYGDYQAMLGAARVAERRLHELVGRYGKETIRAFIRDWFDYSERRMEQAIKVLPSGRIMGKGFHDPFPGVPDGYELNLSVDVDSDAGEIEIDLRQNIDCVPAGINSSMACAVSSVMQGLFSVLDPDLPHNAGSFRRVRVLLRENCIAGIPRFPHSCSLATNQPASRLINLMQSTFAQLGDGWGLAEGGVAQNVGYAVISGSDSRRGGASYVNQLNLANNGGPASPVCDGWLTYSLPVISGLLYRDSVEIDEQRFPLRIRSLRIVPDSGGPGRFRGAPAVRVEYGPFHDPMTIAYPAEGHHTPARGVCGGHDGTRASVVKVGRDGTSTVLPNVYVGELVAGDVVIGVDCGGGGYGDPFEREPALVLADVREGWVSETQAIDAYGVVIAGSAADDSLTVDWQATAAMRASTTA